MTDHEVISYIKVAYANGENVRDLVVGLISNGWKVDDLIDIFVNRVKLSQNSTDHLILTVVLAVHLTSVKFQG